MAVPAERPMPDYRQRCLAILESELLRGSSFVCASLIDIEGDDILSCLHLLWAVDVLD